MPGGSARPSPLVSDVGTNTLGNRRVKVLCPTRWSVRALSSCRKLRKCLDDYTVLLTL